MKTYIVGGYVRDLLLGNHPRDKDFVVIGSSFDEMKNLHFIPVGKSHQVFLHPETREEYTLAKDLFQDLSRRDITINALALSDEKVIDHFGGLKDLRNKLIRHIHEKNFYEDPLRVYRVARFWSQLPDFSIHPDTLRLMQLVSTSKEFQNLPSDRIVGEVAKALSTTRPEKFFEVLRVIGALSCHFPELSSLSCDDWKKAKQAIINVSNETQDIVIRFASLFIYSRKAFTTPLILPHLWVEAKEGARKFYQKCTFLYQESSEEIVELYYSLDAFRRPYMAQILFFLLRATGHRFGSLFFDECFEILRAITSRNVGKAEGREVGELIKQERIKRLRGKLSNVREVRYEREA